MVGCAIPAFGKWDHIRCRLSETMEGENNVFSLTRADIMKKDFMPPKFNF